MNCPQSDTILLGLGANLPGLWGAPPGSLARACQALQEAGLESVGTSRLFLTEPVGRGRQPAYLNAVVAARGRLAPGRLLRLLKAIERRAGRKLTPPMQARPLDIDVLDYGGRRLNWP